MAMGLVYVRGKEVVLEAVAFWDPLTLCLLVYVLAPPNALPLIA